MSQAQLADRVTQFGRPMSASVVSKTEKKERRIDVDDLVAFAVALGVTPNRLLLPPSISDDEEFDLLPGVRVSGLLAWKWVTGDAPMPEELAPPGMEGMLPDDYERVFTRENRPHNAPAAYFHNTDHDVRDHPDLVRMIISVVKKARDEGVDLGRLERLVDEVDRWRLFGHLDQAEARLYGDKG
jgi:transcriptional regulator with XRE-family HTH domain